METIILTYKELAERLGIKPQSARKLVQRKKWKRVAGNDGTMRIHVPLEVLPCHSDSPTDNHNDVSHPVHELQKQIAVLSVELKHANALLDKQTAILEKQINDLKIDRDAWREQAKAKKGWFWRRAG